MKRHISAFAVFLIAASTSVNAGSGSGVGGIPSISLKEKLMNNETLEFADRLELLRYIESLEQPIAVGTGSDTVVIQKGQVFRIGEKKIQENQVLQGESAREVLEN